MKQKSKDTLINIIIAVFMIISWKEIFYGNITDTLTIIIVILASLIFIYSITVGKLK